MERSRIQILLRYGCFSRVHIGEDAFDLQQGVSASDLLCVAALSLGTIKT